MSREKMPNRRASENLKLALEGVSYQCSYSRFPDGRLAEVFIHAGKVGSSINIMARDLAVVTSLALQYGVTLAELRSSLEQELDGTQRGPLGMLLAQIEPQIELVD
jgi:hypothetical protein